MKKHGHYCKVCGEYKSNEKFSGRGHAAHICKVCSSLPPEEKAEAEAVNRLVNLPWQLSNSQKEWLKRRTHDHRPNVQALAQEQYDLRFGSRDTLSVYDEVERDWTEDWGDTPDPEL